MDLVSAILLGSIFFVIVAGSIFFFWFNRSMKKTFKEFDDKMDTLKQDPKTLSGNFSDLTLENAVDSAYGLNKFGLNDSVIGMVDAIREKYHPEKGSKADFDLLFNVAEARFGLIVSREEPIENMRRSRELLKDLEKHQYLSEDGHALIKIRGLKRHLDLEEKIYLREVDRK